MKRPIKLRRDTPELSAGLPGTIRLRPEAAILLNEIAARANRPADECASEIILQSRDFVDVMLDKPRRENVAEKILAAVRANGERGRVVITEHMPGRFAVYVEGSYYGIWDVERRTFVD